MTPSRGIILAKNIAVVADTAPVLWEGGRAALVINATTYPTTVNLQVQGPSGAWISLNASTIAADGAVVYDCPAGQYRLHMTGGTALGVYANLVTVPTA